MSPHELRLAESRARFEKSLKGVQTSLRRELGLPFDLKLWAVPLVALAIGTSLGVGLFARRRRRRKRLGSRGKSRKKG